MFYQQEQSLRILFMIMTMRITSMMITMTMQYHFIMKLNVLTDNFRHQIRTIMSQKPMDIKSLTITHMLQTRINHLNIMKILDIAMFHWRLQHIDMKLKNMVIHIKLTNNLRCPIQSINKNMDITSNRIKNNITQPTI